MTWFLDVNLFRSAAIIAFAATIAVIVLHFVVTRPKFDDVFGKDRGARILDPVRVVIFFVTVLFVEQKWNFVGAVRKLVFLLALLCFVVLLVTGFVPMFFLGKAISGWWLLAHVAAAPVFAVCLAVLAVLWADRNRLDKNYWQWLNSILNRQPKIAVAPEKHELKIRICFWVILLLSLPVIGSETLCMFNLFGPSGQGVLLQLHRYCTLLLSLFAIVYLYLAVLSEMEKTAK